ncbi:isopentenyl-diphosphate Delta-isomerase [Aeromicrobium duanguangcaii]|uniref:Isopentenyl-diphosphate Delta-isomerase n=1 Tax=Aeromicrobium duanguangcaii TaxID=2968086 RepID=A0ABY5KEV7_9ACTN|nr:isopentenyl-diphosphate Delta-isomerase [Aeromicrobium duanguangcaii]MCD9154371.1 isopentenyl-diphosphate Delta-isomerase [Aeromicrobium duanguangcaii]UUI68563.1 isopentenyl-diphosphate Delta-isomerase [Aeromicrobium duanguangcaii]
METVLDPDSANREPDRLPPGDPRDLVVLLDDDHQPRGTASRSAVHSHYTPLHLAFSCYLFDADDRLLVTRRALTKRSWPGVWTNSFCGHPRPQESLEEAVRRHGRSELGVDTLDIRPVLPQFSYRAVDAAGVVENEFCPVFVARAGGGVEPHPDEVAELAWITVDELRDTIRVAPWAVSPWLVAQTLALEEADAWHLLAPNRTETAP